VRELGGTLTPSPYFTVTLNDKHQLENSHLQSRVFRESLLRI